MATIGILFVILQRLKTRCGRKVFFFRLIIAREKTSGCYREDFGKTVCLLYKE